MTDEFLQNIAYNTIDMSLITFIKQCIYPLLIAFILKLIYKNLNFEYLKTMFGLVVFAISTHLLLLNFIENKINKAENKITYIQNSKLTEIQKDKLIQEKKDIITIANGKEFDFGGSAIFVITLVLLYGIITIILRETIFITLFAKKVN